jgi:Flp pilus assembly protein TadG
MEIRFGHLIESLKRCAGALPRAAKLCSDIRGSTSVVFAVSLPVLVLAVGGGTDLTKAMGHRQQIASAVEKACSQSALEISFQIYKGGDAKGDYSQDIILPQTQARLADAGLNNVTVVATHTVDTVTIKATSQSATAFSQLAGMTHVPVEVTRGCPFNPSPPPPDGETLFVESFEAGHNVARNSWTVLGQNGANSSGASWNGWATQNAGIEINGQPQLSGGQIRFGDFFAELDSHCYVAGCNSNSGMTRTVTLQPGTYQIGYWYVSRIRNGNPAWSNVVACAATDSDPAVSPYRAWQDETNRVELHIQDSTQTRLDSKTMIDVCVYSGTWIQRRVDYEVTKAGEYKVTWRAAGRQDTVGGLIDYLQMCREACP